jgi:hypothetical protein
MTVDIIVCSNQYIVYILNFIGDRCVCKLDPIAKQYVIHEMCCIMYVEHTAIVAQRMAFV